MSLFLDEASHWAENLVTDINLPPLMPDEDNKFGGSRHFSEVVNFHIPGPCWRQKGILLQQLWKKQRTILDTGYFSLSRLWISGNWRCHTTHKLQSKQIALFAKEQIKQENHIRLKIQGFNINFICNANQSNLFLLWCDVIRNRNVFPQRQRR